MGLIARLFLLALAPFLLATKSLSAPVQLTLWEHEFEIIQQVLDGVIADFQAAYPDIRVKRAHFKTEDLRTQYQTAALGRGGGDVVIAPNDFGGPFSLMGIIQPVSEWGEIDRFSDGLMQSVKDAKGVAWGLPVSRGNHLMLYVNKKIYPEAPDTVEELVAMAKKSSDPSQGKYGFAYYLNEPFWFMTFMSAFGEYPLVGDKPNLENPGTISALKLVRGFKFDDKIVPPDCDYTCADTLFLEGKVGMIINGDWELMRYAKGLGDNLIVAALPKIAATGLYVAPPTSGKFIFFNANLRNKKLAAAKVFANYLVSRPVQEALVAKTHRLPSLKELAGSPLVLQDPLLAASNKAMEHGIPVPMNVEMRVIWDAMRPQLQGVMAGRIDPTAAVSVMQKDAVIKIQDLRE